MNGVIHYTSVGCFFQDSNPMQLLCQNPLISNWRPEGEFRLVRDGYRVSRRVTQSHKFEGIA